MKVAVYAICKNEESFARRWYASMSEADEVYVLDTGSTDGTPDILRELGAKVTVEKITPWRFDNARNRSLAFVPADVDICVCTDLDEVFHSGWREKLEKAWIFGTKQARYRYTWSFKDDSTEGYVFWIEKIHARHGFVWKHPVHEVLSYIGEEKYSSVYAEGVQLDHMPDKEKSRGQYLPLLELSVEEDPEDDRNMHYLGREYMYYERWQNCIDTLKKHLKMEKAVWRDERCASMRYIAKSYEKLGNTAEAERWYLAACGEGAHLREPWVDCAMFMYRMENWAGVVFCAEKALSIKERPRTYITESDAWGAIPHDLASIGWYWLGDIGKAAEHSDEAVIMAPKDERLLKNNAFFKAAI